MARYRMIVLDLDGTLLSPAGEVTPATKSAVRRALDAGLLVCFATGRNWTESREILDTLEHYPTAVFAGGAVVMDTHHEVTLHRTLVAPDLAREICSLLEHEGHAALAATRFGSGRHRLSGQRTRKSQRGHARLANHHQGHATQCRATF